MRNPRRCENFFLICSPPFEAADPDRVIASLERFVARFGDGLPMLNFLAGNPRAVEILVALFAGSQFLTEILLRNPEFFERLAATAGWRAQKRGAAVRGGTGCACREPEPQDWMGCGGSKVGNAAHRRLRLAGFIRSAGSDPAAIQSGGQPGARLSQDRRRPMRDGAGADLW